MQKPQQLRIVIAALSFFEFNNHPPKNQPFERKLSKLIAFLRTLNIKKITIIHDILKVIFKKL